MTDILAKLQNQNSKVESLRAFGFIEDGGAYRYTTHLLEGQFTLTITITKAGQISTKVVDTDSGDNYILHQIPEAQGVFVGKLREEYQTVLEKGSQCFEINVYQSLCTRQVIEYLREKYQHELEFLWPKSPDSAICRRQDNQKWYVVIMTVLKERLGLNGMDKVEIIDLRMNPDELVKVIDVLSRKISRKC